MALSLVHFLDVLAHMIFDLAQFELVITLKASRRLGLDIPPTC